MGRFVFLLIKILKIWPSLIAAILVMACSTPGRMPSSKSDSSVESEEKRAIYGRAFTYINHADDFFDEDKISQPGVLKLIEWSKAKNIPVIAGIGIPKPKHGVVNQLYPQEIADVVVRTGGGSHSLSFPEADIFFYAGGNLSICLCESVRDSILGAAKVGRELVIVFPKEAIYDSNRARADLRNPFLLEDLSETDLVGSDYWYLRTSIFDKQIGFCRGLRARAEMPADEVTVKVYLGDKELLTEGSGGKVMVKIIIASLADLDQILGKIEK